MRSSLIWVCTVCSDLSVPIFKIITVNSLKKSNIPIPVRTKTSTIFHRKCCSSKAVPCPYPNPNSNKVWSKIIFSELSFYGKKSQKNADRIKNSLVISTNTIFNEMPCTGTNSIWFLFFCMENQKKIILATPHKISLHEKSVKRNTFQTQCSDCTTQIELHRYEKILSMKSVWSRYLYSTGCLCDTLRVRRRARTPSSVLSKRRSFCV